jgi:putative DNA primase/helicase
MRAFQFEAINIEDSDKKLKAVKHALSSENENRIGAMVRMAQSESGVPVMPDQLDRNPYLLNCPNGTLELKTGKRREHRREDLITTLVPVAYDPNATCPLFEAFLERIMGGNTELVRYLQRITGYALTGDVGEKAIFFLYGEGNNGKTTFLEVIRDVLGDYAGQVPIQSLMSKGSGDGIPNDIARLKGLRFVTSSEAEQGRKLAEARVKQLTGMGKLQARFLYGEYFEFDPTFKIFMDANYKPEIRGTDPAIWSRIKLLPFTVEIPPEERDKHLKQKLRAELPGILAWMVRGCLDWQKTGLREPEAVKTSTQSYKAEMDSVANFVEDVCELRPDGEATSKDLYDRYRKWCSEHGEEPVSQKQFGKELVKRGLENKKISGNRGWRGIGFRLSGSLFDQTA